MRTAQQLALLVRGDLRKNRVISAARNRWRWAILVITLSVLIWCLTIVVITATTRGFSVGEWWPSSPAGLEAEKDGAPMEPFGGVLALAVGYVVIFVVPVLMLLPVVLPVAARWRRPLRIVVFRPFNTAYDQRLTKILSKSVARFGHVITLADQNIAPPWSVRIPVFLGQIAFAHFSVSRVRTHADIRRLVSKLSCRAAISVGWLLSFRKVFPVRVADPIWEDCVKAILEDADIVLIDISSRSANVSKEIALSLNLGHGDRVAFLCGANEFEAARAWLMEEVGKLGSVDATIFTYRETIDTQDRFTARLVEMVLAAEEHAKPDHSSLAQTLGPITASTICLASLTCLLAGPYLVPTLAATWSPMRVQLMHAYVYGGAHQALSRVDALDHPYVMTKFREYLDDHYPGVRTMAIFGLGRVGDESAIPLILAHREQVEERIIIKSIERIVNRLGEPASKSLLEAIHGIGPSRTLPDMNGSSEWQQFFASLALKHAQDPRLIPSLLEMSDRESNVDGDDRAIKRLESILKGTVMPLVDPVAFDPWLERAEGQGAKYAVALAFRLDLDQHLGAVLRRRGDMPMAAFFEGLRVCGADVPQRARAILDHASLASLVATGQGNNECARFGALRVLADQGRIEAFAPALSAAHRKSLLFSLYYFDSEANAIFDTLSRTLGPGRKLKLNPNDFTHVAPSSFVPLVRLAAAIEDEESLKAAVRSYEWLDSWDFGDLSESLAASLPSHWSGWVDSLAQQASTREIRERYRTLAAALRKRRTEPVILPRYSRTQSDAQLASVSRA